MPVSFHSLPLLRRTAILLLLGLLLPLQSTLAYARSFAMLAPVSPILAVMPVSEIGAAHLHHAHQHSASVAVQEPLEQAHHISAAAKSCHSNAKNSSACDDCEKCCLMGAAAPPPCGESTHNLSSARFFRIAIFHPLSGFIPDGPERPPRLFHT